MQISMLMFSHKDVHHSTGLTFPPHLIKPKRCNFSSTQAVGLNHCYWLVNRSKGHLICSKTSEKWFKVFGPAHFASPPKALQAKRKNTSTTQMVSVPVQVRIKKYELYLGCSSSCLHAQRAPTLTATLVSSSWQPHRVETVGSFISDWDSFTLTWLLCCGVATHEHANSAWQPVLQPILHRGLMPGRSWILCPGPRGC